MDDKSENDDVLVIDGEDEAGLDQIDEETLKKYAEKLGLTEVLKYLESEGKEEDEGEEEPSRNEDFVKIVFGEQVDEMLKEASGVVLELESATVPQREEASRKLADVLDATEKRIPDIKNPIVRAMASSISKIVEIQKEKVDDSLKADKKE